MLIYSVSCKDFIVLEATNWDKEVSIIFYGMGESNVFAHI